MESAEEWKHLFPLRLALTVTQRLFFVPIGVEWRSFLSHRIPVFQRAGVGPLTLMHMNFHIRGFVCVRFSET
jgi:hypothetical protein